jgi:hypothetical protein
MKIGAENKKEVAIMAVLFAVLLVVGVFNFRDVLWAGPGTDVSSLPVSSAPQQKGPPTISVAQDNEPWLNLDVLRRSREVTYESGNRNLFAYAPTPLPTPVATPRPTPSGSPTPTPVPTPPPIALKFFGFANKLGEPKRVFLAPDDRNSDRTFVAGLNEIVDNRYKIVQIEANQVVVEDMLNNSRQPIPLTPR